jgi:DNA-binding transcriptional LysR family regulator
MRLNLWTEIRTAAQVARLGRVGAAAEVLGMHHSSVIRHIDILEESLRAKLFQRHARGYTPTEAGQELLRTANAVDDQFTQMLARLEHAREQISGQLIVTAIPIMDPIVLPMIGRFQALHPDLQVVYHSDRRPYELSTGEAHVALRAGPRPTQGDHVVSHLLDYRFALYASKSYLKIYGRPEKIDDLARHRLIGGEGDFSRAPFHRWLAVRFPQECFTLMTGAISAEYWAVTNGLGIGFLSPLLATENLVQLFPDYVSPDWQTPIWLVTHVDLHRTTKVQGFTHFVQQEARIWSSRS